MIRAKPKVLTFDEFVKVYPEDGRYELKYHCTRFQGDEQIASPTFPNLDLTINKVLEVEG